MKYLIIVASLMLSTASAYADVVCVPTSNGGYRCYETGPHGCEWQMGGCRR